MRRKQDETLSLGSLGQKQFQLFPKPLSCLLPVSSQPSCRGQAAISNILLAGTTTDPTPSHTHLPSCLPVCLPACLSTCSVLPCLTFLPAPPAFEASFSYACPPLLSLPCSTCLPSLPWPASLPKLLPCVPLPFLLYSRIYYLISTAGV